MKLGKVISGYRESKGITLRDLAKEIGVNHTSLWRLENGQSETCKQWPLIMRWLFEK